jgi:hypothetical protein
MKSTHIKPGSEMGSKRHFMFKVVAIMALSGTYGSARSQPKPAELSETDPQAVSLGYKADATKVDKGKFKGYQSGQLCSNCNLFKAEANAASGVCAIFPGKNVAAKGWCSAWIKKG